MPTPLRIKAELQEIIPERVLKRGEAVTIRIGKKSWQIKLMFAVELYLGELDLEATELAKNARRVQELNKNASNSSSHADVSQDQQQHRNVERDPAKLEKAMEEQHSSLDAFEEVLDVFRSTKSKCRLRLTNFAATTTEAELGAFLSGYTVKTISIMSKKKYDGLATALVSLGNAVETKKARSELSGKKFRGRKLIVHYVRGTDTIPTAGKGREKRKALLRMRGEEGPAVKKIKTRVEAEAPTTSEAQVEKGLSKMSSGAIVG